GVYHTVNPLANDVIPIYKENTREFSIIKSENFGNILTMEVGALLVGRIVNYHEKANVRRGEEKGKFEFGGSTIILCLEKGRVIIDEDILANSLNGVETVVKMGEKIGIA
ncbi:phosphatidylserine decarboxylase, partial [Lachnotalea glycerini]